MISHSNLTTSINNRILINRGILIKSYIIKNTSLVIIRENISESLKIFTINSEIVDINELILENYNIISKSLLSFLDNISESINIIDDISIYIDNLVSLIDTLELSINSSNNIVYLNSLIELFKVLDLLDKYFNESINESLLLNPEIINILNSINELNNSFKIIESVTNYNIYISLTYDQLNLLDSSITLSNFIESLSSGIELLVKNSKTDKYISYLLSPETFSVTEYNNYNFYGSCKFQDKYLFINNKGLFEYGGNTDDNQIIESKIKTSALTFGTSNLKQLPNFYIGVSNSGKLILKINIDGKATVYYKLNKPSKYLQTQKISIGKGLIGRYFQFELITLDNSEFTLEDMEFTPMIMKRKI